MTKRCTHPPRQWHGEMLMPCANPLCVDTSPGDYYNVVQPNCLVVSYARRVCASGPDGVKYDWWKEPETARRRLERRVLESEGNTHFPMPIRVEDVAALLRGES
jgi:hypothetical protein